MRSGLSTLTSKLESMSCFIGINAVLVRLMFLLSSDSVTSTSFSRMSGFSFVCIPSVAGDRSNSSSDATDVLQLLGISRLKELAS